MKPALALTLIALLLAGIGVSAYRVQHADATEGNAATPSADAYNITFERTGCLGYCPAFLLLIDVEGHVRLQMPAFTDVESGEPESGLATYVTQLPASRMKALARRFDTGGFRRLKLDYSVDVTDGSSTTISIDSPHGHWATQVYVVPCASSGKRWSAETRNHMGMTEFVPDVFCELSDALDDIACEAYQHGSRLGSVDDLKPFRPPHCRSPR
ncbi:MAG: DUF6438 domain-containing protein [Lysobacteraceae bacterium]